MISLPSLFNYLWWLSTIASVAALVRLFGWHLWRSYPALTLYLLVDLAGNLLGHYARSRAQYIAIWEITAPLSWLALVWLVFSLYAQLTAGYPGAARFGAWLGVALLGISITSAVWIGQYSYPRWAGVMARLYSARQGVAFALAVFVLMMSKYFYEMRIPRAPNLIRHSRITTGLCVGFAIQAVLINVTGKRVLTELQSLTVSILAVCSFCWAFLLTSAGEIEPPVRVLSPEELARIDQQSNDLIKGLRGIRE